MRAIDVANNDAKPGTLPWWSSAWFDARRCAGSIRSGRRLLRAAAEPQDQFDWITAFFQERGLLPAARRILAMVAATAGLVPLTLLAGQRHPVAALVVAHCCGMGLATVMAVCWLRRWPTRRQSQTAAITGVLCIAGWSVAQPNPALSAQICAAAAITGGYIAFFHGTRLMALNLVAAVAIDAMATRRLASATDFVTAAGSFWLILLLNLSVPVAIRALSRTIRLYATRSNEDALTGLFNRRAFTETVAARLADPPSTHSHLVILMIDLDNFKRLNDTHGHAVGDRTLVAVGDLLRRHTPRGAAICRAGGEEFLIAFTASAADPSPLANQLCTAIAALTPCVTASIGTTSVELHTVTSPVTHSAIDRLVDFADNAMYAAKRNGGHRAHHVDLDRRWLADVDCNQTRVAPGNGTHPASRPRPTSAPDRSSYPP